MNFKYTLFFAIFIFFISISNANLLYAIESDANNDYSNEGLCIDKKYIVDLFYKVPGNARVTLVCSQADGTFLPAKGIPPRCANGNTPIEVTEANCVSILENFSTDGNEKTAEDCDECHFCSDEYDTDFGLETHECQSSVSETISPNVGLSSLGGCSMQITNKCSCLGDEKDDDPGTSNHPGGRERCQFVKVKTLVETGYMYCKIYGRLILAKKDQDTDQWVCERGEGPFPIDDERKARRVAKDTSLAKTGVCPEEDEEICGWDNPACYWGSGPSVSFERESFFHFKRSNGYGGYAYSSEIETYRNCLCCPTTEECSSPVYPPGEGEF